MTNAVNVLQDIVNCLGPTAVEAKHFDPYLMRFLKRCENLAFCDLEDMEPGDCTSIKTFRVFGADAMGETYDQCKTNTGLPDPAVIKFMRTFRWVLDPTENEQVEEWQRIAVLTARDRLTEQRAKALKDVEASTSQPTKSSKLSRQQFFTRHVPPSCRQSPKEE